MREAKQSDIPYLLGLSANYYDGSSNKFVNLNLENLAQTFSSMIDNDNWLVLIDQRSFFCGCLQASPSDHNHIVAIHLYWFSEVGSGVKLLRRFISWARDNGATSANISLEYVDVDAKLTRAMKRLGFSPSHVVFSGVI